MELKRDEIVKALECCSSREDTCDYCPLDELDSIDCRRILHSLSLSLIKELTEEKNKVFEAGARNLSRLELSYLTLEVENTKLTEENERLRADNLYGLSASELAKKVEKISRENEQLRNRVVCKVVIPDEKMEEIKNECLEKVELDIKAIQADTVWKMQKLIKERCIKGGLYPAFVASTIDQIAEEIIEGEIK